MANGRELVIARDDGASGYEAVCVTGQRSLNINNEEIDITKPDCASPGSKLAYQAMYGIQSLTFSGAGAYVNNAAKKAVVADAVNQVTKEYRVTVPDIGTFTGDGILTTLDLSGEMTGELQASFTLKMTGTIVYVAAS